MKRSQWLINFAAAVLCILLCIIMGISVMHKANYRRYVDNISSMEQLLADECQAELVDIVLVCDYATNRFPSVKKLQVVGFQVKENVREIRLAVFAEKEKGTQLLKIIPQSHLYEISKQISLTDTTINIDGIVETLQIIVSTDPLLDSVMYRSFLPEEPDTVSWNVIGDIQSPLILVLEGDNDGYITEYKFMDSAGNEITG